MEKWVKVLQAQAPGDLGVKQVWNTVIKMVLVMLPVDNCTKLAVGQWTAWWSSLPRGLTVGGSLVFCLIIVVILIGLGRVYRLGEWGGRLDFEVMKWGKATKGLDHFYGGSRSLKTPCRDFNLVIVRGLGSMKWLKNGTGKCLYFMQLLFISLLVKILLLKLSTFIFSMLESQSWKNKIVTKIGRLKKWLYLLKLLTITITSSNFFQLSCCPVKL